MSSPQENYIPPVHGTTDSSVTHRKITISPNLFRLLSGANIISPAVSGMLHTIHEKSPDHAIYHLIKLLEEKPGKREIQ